jgi:hypothetical protein
MFMKSVSAWVVIHVGDGKLGPNPRDADRLELEVRHGSRGVLREGLIDQDPYLLSRFNNSLPAMGFEDLHRDRRSHAFLHAA